MKTEGKVIKMKHVEETPADVAISRNMQNLFATYGEKKVRATLKTLFNLEAKRSKKAA
jgi:hypothetical protein